MAERPKLCLIIYRKYCQKQSISVINLQTNLFVIKTCFHKNYENSEPFSIYHFVQIPFPLILFGHLLYVMNKIVNASREFVFQKQPFCDLRCQTSHSVDLSGR